MCQMYSRPRCSSDTLNRQQMAQTLMARDSRNNETPHNIPTFYAVTLSCSSKSEASAAVSSLRSILTHPVRTHGNIVSE